MGNWVNDSIKEQSVNQLEKLELPSISTESIQTTVFKKSYVEKQKFGNVLT